MIKAKFSNKTKQEIAERDGYCIISGCTRSGPPHHVFFGMEAERTPDRNKTNKGCILCMEEHHPKAHACKRGEGLRQECINYVTNL